MRFRQRNTSVYKDLRPTAAIALVRPNFSSGAAGNYWEIVEEFRGLYLSLLETHLPFDVVPISELAALETKGELGRYTLVVLPDLGNMGSAATAVDAFVRRGGKVISTGSAGLSRDGDVEMSSSLALQALTPALEGTELRSTYVTDQPQPRMADYHYQAPLLPVFGRYQRPSAHPNWPTATKEAATPPMFAGNSGTGKFFISLGQSAEPTGNSEKRMSVTTSPSSYKQWWSRNLLLTCTKTLS
jgi:hypothetical protein